MLPVYSIINNDWLIKLFYCIAFSSWPILPTFCTTGCKKNSKKNLISNWLHNKVPISPFSSCKLVTGHSYWSLFTWLNLSSEPVQHVIFLMRQNWFFTYIHSFPTYWPEWLGKGNMSSQPDYIILFISNEKGPTQPIHMTDKKSYEIQFILWNAIINKTFSKGEEERV